MATMARAKPLQNQELQLLLRFTNWVQGPQDLIHPQLISKTIAGELFHSWSSQSKNLACYNTILPLNLF